MVQQALYARDVFNFYADVAENTKAVLYSEEVMTGEPDRLFRP
jgi:hypothetical protein